MVRLTDAVARVSLLWKACFQVPRYALVAITCAALHNVIMIALDGFGIHYGFSLLASTCFLVPVGFWLHCAFTFTVDRSWRAFCRYAVVMALNLPLSFVFVWLSFDIMQLPMIVAAPLSTVLLFAWNFLASRWAVYQRPAEAVQQ